jgi:4-amino-4-deoxy-L-arabinose transferase-like glycosyltransferase
LSRPDAKPAEAGVPVVVLAVFGLALFGAVLRLAAPDESLRRSPDEKVYTRQAQALAQEGVAGIRKLVAEHERDRSWWVYPPPGRIGYLALRAAVMKLTGVWDENAGVYLSCGASILVLALIAFLGLRYFDPWTTLLALAFASASLVDLVIVRRAWADGVQILFAAASMALAFEVRRRAGAVAWCAAFAAVSAYAVTVKESGALVYAVWLGWLLWFFVRERAWRKTAILVGAAAVSTLVTLVVWSWAAGGWSALVSLYQRYSAGYAAAPYGLEFCSGPWHRFVLGAFLLAPLPFVLFPFAAVRAVHARDAVAVGMALFAVVLFLPALLPRSQNYRYVALILPAVYLLAGKAARDLLAPARERLDPFVYRMAVAAACILVALNAIHSRQNLARMDAVNQSVDLSVKMVSDALS